MSDGSTTRDDDDHGATAAELRETFRRFGRDAERLRPIDLLVKHREVFGFAALDALEALAMSCVAAGPAQSHLRQPLVDDGAALVRHLRATAALREFVRDEIGFTLDIPAWTAAQFAAAAVPRLMQTVGVTKWARTADSRHLRIRLHSLQLAQQIAANGEVAAPMVFPSQFKLRAVVTYKSVLMKDIVETHTTGPECFNLSSDSSSGEQQQQQQEVPRAALSSSMSFSNVNLAPFVDVTTMFRTKCTGSCTIRVAIDTQNGMEFAHGFIRASFAPGDETPTASFSVPLVRPANLSAMSAAAEKAKSSAKVSSKVKSASSSKAAAAAAAAAASKKKKEQQQQQTSTDSPVDTLSAPTSQPNLSGSVSGLGHADRHQRLSPLGNIRNPDSPACLVDGGILVGSLSVDIDSIASSFLNLIAMTRIEKARQQRGAASSGAEPEDDSKEKPPATIASFLHHLRQQHALKQQEQQQQQGES